MIKKIVLVVALIIGIFYLTSPINGQDCGSDLQCQIDQIQREIDALSPAHEKNKTELNNLRTQITSLNKKIDSFSKQIVKNESEIKEREKDLELAKKLFE